MDFSVSWIWQQNMMAEGNSKLPGEINELNEKLEQRQNAELMGENAKLKEKNIKLMEEIEMLKKEKLQISIPRLPNLKRPHDEGCGNLALKDGNAKKTKQFGNSIPNWFLEALDWIKRTELAQTSLTFSSKTFNQICFPKLHGNVKPHNIRKLTFSHSWDEEGNSRSVLRKNERTLIPIASINPPEYITGFKKIKFCFIDGRALKFIKKILPLLNDVRILFKKWRGNDARLGPIDRLMALLSPKTYELGIPVYIASYGMNYLDKQLPGLLNDVRSVWLAYYCYCNCRDVGVLSNWLAMPRKDGQKKLLDVSAFRSDSNCLVEKVKKQFFDSEEPTNFILRIDEEDLASFRVENEKTDEILELYEKSEEKFLIRHRKNDEIDKIDWEEEFDKKSKTSIEIKLIGDFSPELPL